MDTPLPTAEAVGLLFSTGTPCLEPRLGARASVFCLQGDARSSDPRDKLCPRDKLVARSLSDGSLGSQLRLLASGRTEWVCIQRRQVRMAPGGASGTSTRSSHTAHRGSMRPLQPAPTATSPAGVV